MDQHHPRKRFGQNFLHDAFVLAHMVETISPRENDHVIEIGPGKGALTELLLPHCAHLTGVEIDRDLVKLLKEKFAHVQNLTLLEQDALTFQLPASFPSYRVVGNLPYNISTPLLFHLFAQIEHVQDFHFLLQKEVVERLAASPGNKTYGRLSVMTQYFCQVEPCFEVPPTAFYPMPSVYSAFVRLTPVKQPIPVKNFERFKHLVTSAFTKRRKTLTNALKSFVTPEALRTLDIDPMLRPENLTVEQFIAISHLDA
ncbi:MAG TPA: 16S rRNA (adenine(1518)-N(6)/adenine(1519)-N(6))-dimethyltransferase RsmA [Coxiellaceae bacterium]|nr:16S rRNA (adenine(1518)-N(6)/adenine(1519)-N(6))-dimethyltransferase RsmA [Coxiellaceae bacterium]